MNHEHFQELVQSIQNSDLLSEISYSIGFGNPTAESPSGEIHSIFSSENHLMIVNLALVFTLILEYSDFQIKSYIALIKRVYFQKIVISQSWRQIEV